MRLYQRHWNSFKKNHHTLVRMPEFEESEYNTNDVFNTTELSYTEHITWLEEEIEKLQPSSSSSDTSTSTTVPMTQSNTEAVMRQI